MRYQLHLLIALTLAVPAGTALHAAGKIPPILYSSQGGVTYPVWVSQEAATDSDGGLNGTFFSPADVEMLRFNLENDQLVDADGCTQLDEFYESIVNRPDRSTLERTFTHSPTVVVGQVVAEEYGFERGVPGQLFELQVESSFGAEYPNETLFAFFPVGEFRVGRYRICKTDRRYARVPEIGERLIVALSPLTPLLDPLPYLDSPNCLIVLPTDGPPHYPKRLLDDAEVPATVTDLLSKVQSHSGQRNGGDQ